ncbi:hypothetical protein TNCV_4102301 [Trichonephila clavipes]|nr:hypothetical protein TNCV_4102301 [Trichonephila clavipes]
MSLRRPLFRLPLTGHHKHLRRQCCDERPSRTTEWMALCLLINPDSACSITMVEFEYGDLVVRVRIVGTLNSQRCSSEVLEPVVLPWVQRLPLAIVQQDNA